jgi:hypothetical protein
MFCVLKLAFGIEIIWKRAARSARALFIAKQGAFDEGLDGKKRTADGVHHFGGPRSGDLLLCHGFSHDILRGAELDEL